MTEEKTKLLDDLKSLAQEAIKIEEFKTATVLHVLRAAIFVGKEGLIAEALYHFAGREIDRLEDKKDKSEKDQKL